tara:strand:- start:289 stop:621 length:333 start_codon:yes stop_codon:yes gene_type:complete
VEHEGVKVDQVEQESLYVLHHDPNHSEHAFARSYRNFPDEMVPAEPSARAYDPYFARYRFACLRHFDLLDRLRARDQKMEGNAIFQKHRLHFFYRDGRDYSSRLLQNQFQ